MIMTLFTGINQLGQYLTDNGTIFVLVTAGAYRQVKSCKIGFVINRNPVIGNIIKINNSLGAFGIFRLGMRLARRKVCAWYCESVTSRLYPDSQSILFHRRQGPHCPPESYCPFQDDDIPRHQTGDVANKKPYFLIFSNFPSMHGVSRLSTVTVSRSQIK